MKQNQELAIIITVLVLLCLSAIGMLEAIEQEWIDF